MIDALNFVQQDFKDSENYLLVGDNDFLYLFIKNRIKRFCGEHFIVEMFDCTEKSTSEDALIASFGEIDMFGQDKIVIVKNINKLSKKNQDFVLQNVNNESKKVYIFVDHSFLSFDYKSKKNSIKNSFSKKLSKSMTSVNISTPFESEMKQWIKIFSKELNLTIDERFSNELINNFGNNFSEIYNDLYNQSILGGDLDSMKNVSVNFQKNKQLWEFNYAICDKNIEKIYETGFYLMKQHGLPYIINSFFTIFDALFLTKINNGTLFEGSSRNIKGNVVKRIASSSNKYTLDELENAIKILNTLDKKIKTKKIIDESEFTNAVNGIFKNEG